MCVWFVYFLDLGLCVWIFDVFFIRTLAELKIRQDWEVVRGVATYCLNRIRFERFGD